MASVETHIPTTPPPRSSTPTLEGALRSYEAPADKGTDFQDTSSRVCNALADALGSLGQDSVRCAGINFAAIRDFITADSTDALAKELQFGSDKRRANGQRRGIGRRGRMNEVTHRLSFALLLQVDAGKNGSIFFRPKSNGTMAQQDIFHDPTREPRIRDVVGSRVSLDPTEENLEIARALANAFDPLLDSSGEVCPKSFISELDQSEVDQFITGQSTDPLQQQRVAEIVAGFLDYPQETGEGGSEPTIRQVIAGNATEANWEIAKPLMNFLGPQSPSWLGDTSISAVDFNRVAKFVTDKSNEKYARMSFPDLKSDELQKALAESSIKLLEHPKGPDLSELSTSSQWSLEA